jgi:phytoene dehydrogenase-like protein
VGESNGRMSRYDVVVVGSGPNGLSAAVAMARAGRSVLVLEARDEVGGGASSAELTLPGFVHDPFSAVHPLGIGSPFFRGLPLAEHGLDWVHPEVPLAHPFDRRPAALLEPSIEATVATLEGDGAAYRALVEPFVERWDPLFREALAPLHLPRRPVLLGRFGLLALQSAYGLANRSFSGDPARALFAGIAAHATVPLTKLATAAFGLMLLIAGHSVGWPVAKGGSGSITRALASYLRSLGGEIRTGVRVRSLADLPVAKAVFFNLTPAQLLRVAGDRLPATYRRRLRNYLYGPGVFKMDWALSEPIPWRDPSCARAGTLHLGGTLEEISRSTEITWAGRPPDNPFVLVAQPSLFDPTRAPPGKHVGWAYCHVPNGSTVDMTERIEQQIERYAPGFRDVILARSSMGPAELERRNPNLVGGEINGGAAILGQIFFRPMIRWSPHRIPVRGFYLASASAPPGGGVHGMGGYYAAQAALADGY